MATWQSAAKKFAKGAAGRIGMSLLSAAGVSVVRAPASVASTPAPPIEQVPQVAAPAPGFAPTYQIARDQTDYAELARTNEALFGKISNRLGPTNPRWSTFQGELKPENIAAALEQANAGLPFTFCDMSRRSVENDSHLSGCVLQTFSSIVAKPDRFDPPETLARDPLAVSVSHWMRAAREQVPDYDAARFALLWAEGVGFSGAENVFGYRRVTWRTAAGQRITREYCVPVKLEVVEGRAFRFDTETDEPLLWLQGDYCSLPPAKFVFHVAHGVSQIRERRGFMRSCLPLSAIRQWTVRDCAIYLHIYGIPQAVIEYSLKQFQYGEHQHLVDKLIATFGQGGIPTVPTDVFRLRTDTPGPDGALVHTQAADWLNNEVTKAVTGGGPLQMASSGGSNGLGDVHAEGAYAAQVLRAQNLCDSLLRDTWWPTLQLNQYRLAADLGERPDDILACLPRYTPQIDRVSDPEKKQKIFSQAMRDGCPVSLTQYRAALQIDAPRDEADTLKGVGVPIPSSGAVVSAVDASGGVLAPSPNGDVPTTSPVLHSLNPAADQVQHGAAV